MATKLMVVETNMDTGEVNEYYKEVAKPLSGQKRVKKTKDLVGLSGYLNSEIGGFTFMFYEKLIHLKNVTDANKMRFLYLSTFVNYENFIVKRVGTKDIKCNRKDLEELCKIKKRTFNSAIKEIIESGLIEEVEGEAFRVNSEYIKKGGLSKSEKNEEFTRLFNDYLRNVYVNTVVSSHKQLFYFFVLLPNIHNETNILCKDASCEVDNISPLTTKEMAFKIGYDVTNSSKLWRELRELFIFDERSDFRSVFGKFDCKYGKDSIIINPRLYYKGNSEDVYKFLDSLFN
ncbi:MAG: hypothetical protein ACRDDY_02350 [Clostridium sp.]|uniref:hypothetical protein n=1 Tax=Clostridium sp. TaxID=1506 RepID=UPI003EE6EB8E